MSEVAAASEAIAQVRKERVHTTMLIELLALLVFLAMVFAFVFREEGDKFNPWKAKAESLEQQLAAEQRRSGALQRQVYALQAEIRTLTEANRQLAQAHQGVLAPSQYVMIPQATIDGAGAKAGNDQAIIEELQREIEQLRARLAAVNGKGGVDLPNCPVTAGFLVTIDFEGDGGFRVSPAWRAGAQERALAVPGLRELTSSGELDRGRFAALGEQVARWGRSRPQPCGFRARVVEHHGDLALYKRQLGLVEQSFYVSRR